MIKLEKTQETPCSLSSVIDMWLRFGCQVKFLQNCILTGDLLKSKSKFASKVNTPNFPHDQRQNPRPLPGSIVDSGSSEIRDRGSTAPLAGPNAAPSPRRDTGGGHCLTAPVCFGGDCQTEGHDAVRSSVCRPRLLVSCLPLQRKGPRTCHVASKTLFAVFRL